MKKIITILAVTLSISLSGCAELKEETMEPVRAHIESVRYVPTRVHPVRVGKVTTMQTSPSKHLTTLVYEDLKTEVNDKNLYEYAKNNIGEPVEVELTTKTYEDGTIKRYIDFKEGE